MAKKRNPQDTTLRNARAAKTQLQRHERRIKALEVLAHDLWKAGARITNLERQLARRS